MKPFSGQLYHQTVVPRKGRGPHPNGDKSGRGPCGRRALLGGKPKACSSGGTEALAELRLLRRVPECGRQGLRRECRQDPRQVRAGVFKIIE